MFTLLNLVSFANCAHFQVSSFPVLAKLLNFAGHNWRSFVNHYPVGSPSGNFLRIGFLRFAGAQVLAESELH